MPDRLWKTLVGAVDIINNENISNNNHESNTTAMVMWHWNVSVVSGEKRNVDVKGCLSGMCKEKQASVERNERHLHTSWRRSLIFSSSWAWMDR